MSGRFPSRIWQSSYLGLSLLTVTFGIVVFLMGDCAGQEALIRFEDVTARTGIEFIHSDGSCGDPQIQETVTGGLATLDYDGDGMMDLFFTSAVRAGQSEKKISNRLYRNLGGWRFEDVTEQAGLAGDWFTLGVVVGDYNNDGFPDIFINNWGQNVLFENNGNGTFSPVMDDAIYSARQLGAGACFLDIDGNGNLDLWIGNYVQLDRRKAQARRSFGSVAAPGPRDFESDYDQLLRNNGDGTFSEISQLSGIQSVAGTSMGMICFDFDQDGDTDVFVCNDAMENFLWENDGSGHFTEVGQLLGVAYGFGGATQASMGVDCADWDNDGWLDLVATNFDSEVPNAYINRQGAFFEDLSVRMGLGHAARDVKWGIVLSDFDRDGFVDLAIATGHLYEGITAPGSALKVASRNRLFRNEMGKKFTIVPEDGQGGFAQETVGRGMVAEDLDNDGAVDLVVNNLNSLPQILQNITDTENHWLKIRLVGTRTTRDAVGSTVIVRTRQAVYRQEVHRGRGYQSHYGNWLHFGLGREVVESVEVHWHGGQKQVLTDLPTNSQIVIIQESNSDSWFGN